MAGGANERYKKLPPIVDPRSLVIEIPAFEDDRPAPDPLQSGAVPELEAATQVAQGSGGVRTIRRMQIPVALVIVGVPMAVVLLIAVGQILMAP